MKLLVWQIKFEKLKALKELNGELILIAYHPRRCWKFCMSEDEKKEIGTIFDEEYF